MIVRPALQPGKNRAIDRGGKLFAAQDHRAARPAQSLVGGGGYNVGKWYWVGMDTAHDQPCNVRDVRKQICADRIRNFTERLEIELAWISGGSGYNNPRLFLTREIGQSIVVDHLRLAIHRIGNRSPELARQ